MNLRALWKRYPKCFQGSRWAFWILALGPVVLLAGLPCNPNGGHFFWGYLLLLILSCFWEAHVRYLLTANSQVPRTVLSILGRAFANFLSVFFAGLVLAIPAVLFLPTYQCYTDRAKVSEVVLAASDFRQTIAERIRISKTLDKVGAGLTVEPQGRVVGGTVTESGTVILVAEDPPSVVTLTPKIVDAKTGEINWDCLGYPRKIMPFSCRGEPLK